MEHSEKLQFSDISNISENSVRVGGIIGGVVVAAAAAVIAVVLLIFWKKRKGKIMI